MDHPAHSDQNTNNIKINLRVAHQAELDQEDHWNILDSNRHKLALQSNSNIGRLDVCNPLMYLVKRTRLPFQTEIPVRALRAEL